MLNSISRFVDVTVGADHACGRTAANGLWCWGSDGDFGDGLSGMVVVAHVTAASELSDAQRDRLTEVLTRIYGHPVSVQLHVDPELLGGLSIAVGDEVIDGSIASRLAAAHTQLPD